MTHTITVSVVVITYNHENFIKQCIDGILMQKCNFPVEIIIANDHSPDSTDDIMQEYLTKYPKAGYIKYFNHPKNLGIMENLLFALKQAKGKYIALCEGDDYWSDPDKLQKQVDFMEKNPDFSITFHQVQFLVNNILTDRITPLPGEVMEVSTIKDLSEYNYIPTLSVLFKNSFDYPSYIKKSFIGDYPLHLHNAENGKIKYIPGIMAVYRDGSGTWSSENKSVKDRKMVYSLSLIINHYKNKPEISKNLIRQQNFYLYSYLSRKTPEKKSVISDLFQDEFFRNVSFRNKLYLLIKFFLKKDK